MKIGMLIIFRNDAPTIDVQKFIELFDEKKNLNVCFVNNSSTDHTLKLLREIQEDVNIPISIIDVKKNRGQHAAIKAGIRYVNSIDNVPYILCLQAFSKEAFSTLNKVFRLIQQDKEIVTALFSKTECLAHKNVFSLHDVLEVVC
jgi:glycosyltransferase involved in cell wall biosynthesis